MRMLNFRTAPDMPRRRPILKRGKTPVVVVTGPKCYFVRRCPWTGYFYAKGGRERRCNGSYQRAIRGMKWNHYMREGLKPLKNHASELMFFVNLSIAWGLIKRWRARGGSTPRMPLQEGIMGETIRIRLPANLPNKSERRCRKETRPEGRPRIEAVGQDQKIEGTRGTKTSSTPTRRLDDDDEEEEVRDVMRFPGMTVIKESPESYVKLVRPIRTKLLISDEKKKVRRKPSAKRRTTVMEGSAPGRVKTKKPSKARGRNKKITMRDPKVPKKRPKEVRGTTRGRVTAARKQGKPAVVLQIAPSQEPKAREIKTPRWVYVRKYRPPVSSARKKVIQLKVTRADDPNLPR